MRRALASATAAAACLGVLAGCGSASERTAAPASSTHLISASRCAANRAAGPITFLTGYEWSGTVGTIDVVAAAANGWFADMCLDVRIVAGTGDPAVATSTVASGRTTIAEVGGASDVLTAVAGGVPVKAIATYGNVFAETLITMATTTSLTQLEGEKLGYKGTAFPPEIAAELERAGVDVAKVDEIGNIGYDPTVLPRGKVQALTGYISSDLPELQSDGYKVRSWTPGQFGIEGTFNTLVANDGFAAAHPSAVEDFLRATFHAYSWCEADLTACLADEAAKAPAGEFDTATERTRFDIESKLVDDHLLPGKGLGAESVAQFTPEEQLLYGDKLISSEPDLARVVAPQYVAAVESGTSVVWPAP